MCTGEGGGAGLGELMQKIVVSFLICLQVGWFVFPSSCLYTALSYLRQVLKYIKLFIKGTKSLISIDPPYKDDNARFITVHLKL